ncbi:putative immunity protein [Microcella humidisoli]|uniref:Exonuclease SbcC n=1 Tax=Microcella humidisoli TaxID=2963406 RepID=A0ABY5FXU6_9MICO|nr:exonuclease SbcC [Microcella humidisoli]UTT62959.1 exonuclease SbcC [Microcella humidisoli]
MNSPAGDFELTLDELRVVVRYVAESAQEILPFFEDACPDDGRPRAAVDAAWVFIDGARRTNLQRVAAFDAHRAAAAAPTESARLAAQAAGDAAAAAYLHPIAKGHQVGHILRAAANAACIAEHESGDGPAASAQVLARALERADAVLVDVLSRYPRAPRGRSRAAHLMVDLDELLRGTR